MSHNSLLLPFASKIIAPPAINIYVKPRRYRGKHNKKHNPLAKALVGKSQRGLFPRSLPNELQYIDEFDPYEHLAYDNVQIHFNNEWGHVKENTVHNGMVVGGKDGSFVVFIDTWKYRDCWQRTAVDIDNYSNLDECRYIELKDVYIFNPRYKTNRSDKMDDVARAIKAFRNSLRRRKSMFTTSIKTTVRV